MSCNKPQGDKRVSHQLARVYISNTVRVHVVCTVVLYCLLSEVLETACGLGAATCKAANLY